MNSAIALDLGTTSIKACLFEDGAIYRIVARASPEITADGGRYESDALAYAATVDAVLAEGLAATAEWPPLGLCSQRSSFLIWERVTGRPVTPLISWQDIRGAASCEALRGEECVVRDLTGLQLAAYYLAPKLRILLLENPSWRDHLLSGAWLLGTLDTFIIWRWTGGKYHLTDASMAARTLLMDIHGGQWSAVLCELFDIPCQILPYIWSTNGWSLQLDNGLILQSSVSDQSAALYSSIDTGQPEALVNLGTGGFVIRYLGDGCNACDGYLQTLVWQDKAKQTYFACEGTLNSIAQALAPYVVDGSRTEDLARDNIFCIAEPGGLGAPYFRKDLGLTFSEPTGHLSEQRVTALLLEGIIFRVTQILEDMHRESCIARIYLSGGLSNLHSLQQGIAQCATFAATYRLNQPDASLAGAARLAAGQALANDRHAVKVDVMRPVPGLSEKYARWKIWLAELLR